MNVPCASHFGFRITNFRIESGLLNPQSEFRTPKFYLVVDPSESFSAFACYFSSYNHVSAGPRALPDYTARSFPSPPPCGWSTGSSQLRAHAGERLSSENRPAFPNENIFVLDVTHLPDGGSAD